MWHPLGLLMMMMMMIMSGTEAGTGPKPPLIRFHSTRLTACFEGIIPEGYRQIYVITSIWFSNIKQRWTYVMPEGHNADVVLHTVTDTYIWVHDHSSNQVNVRTESPWNQTVYWFTFLVWWCPRYGPLATTRRGKMSYFILQSTSKLLGICFRRFNYGKA
jgi:hypothetical protein